MTNRSLFVRRWPKPSVSVVGVLAVAVIFGPGLSMGGADPTAEAVVKTAEEGPCLLPRADMRRRHKALLFEEQELAVRHGQRNPEASLNRCVTCHAVLDDVGQVIPYEDERHFCRACHVQVAVALDCFSCHRSTPIAPLESAANP